MLMHAHGHIERRAQSNGARNLYGRLYTDNALQKLWSGYGRETTMAASLDLGMGSGGTSIVKMLKAVPKIDYYLVLDFEATCDEITKPEPQEIIEFPVLKVNATTMETEAIFHTYVQPTAHPKLTPFCTQLTGITQEMVNGKPSLLEVLEMFDQWMEKEELKVDANVCFVTCGDWDLKTMLPSQCEHLKVSVPPYFKQWLNIKKAFKKITGTRAVSMVQMLGHLGLTLDGRHHSGIDDSKNIAKILKELIKRSPNIQPTTVQVT